MKESHTVQTAEYALAQEIYHETVLNWWVNTVFSKSLQMISLVKKRNACYLNNTHKFGIDVPKLVAQAYAMDEKNGNTLWLDYIAK